MPNSVWASDRLIFRAIEPEDDAFFHAFKIDAPTHLNVAFGTPKPQGKKDATRTRESLQNSLLGVAITLRPDPDAAPTTDPPVTIGFTCLRAEDNMRHHRCAAVGISIGKQYQGKGYGTETIRWLLHWGFRYGNLHRVEMEAFGWNTTAIRLYEHLGFTMEGRKKECLFFDDKWWDVLMFGMLEGTWREMQEKRGIEK
ncbi:acyl-CoA N-acyltransferase [Myriangium duriaei CBS 260.36]|uniref:Acyl-CoA N-acyltransferase n=1 Tax=Myriangium duriaei CBS 260.36 TaxID=1168546 RepID=A0A9P4MEC0_9PEZI|nr:acyl-CoA N-acyltransferase [Myriangium duriaei CBS 260.36]